jgi:formate hydrogenlyase subunit 3/multisubunit Na+/H+ antiporter MnhD subunit
MVLTALLALAGFLLAVGAGGAFLVRAPGAFRIVYGACLAATAAGLALALDALLGGAEDGLVLPLGLPWIGAHFRLDPLSAFFLAVVNLGGAAASLYGLGYGRHEHDQGRVLPYFPAFLAGMTLVLLAADAFTFLLSWEFMSVTSWALVMAHHRESGNARAGYVYLVMASFGTLALLLAFGLLAGPDGAYTFDAMRQAVESPGLAALVLALVLLGAGSKAGIVPLHVWLPLAHPAAPSHVSALMSGVMTKVAVYGFIRIVFDLLGAADWWWGAVVVGLGGVTAVLGVLYALMERDLKRLLAYSTVENIGIIYIGLGLALAFQSNGMSAAAALALTAALFHVLNHALFKSLLFFGAGAVLTATGLRDLEQLGGLIHRMPKTALAFLVGAAAISALPPLNGFVSEWLTLQAILLSPPLPQWVLKFTVAASGALLALAAALAATCFVRAFGIAFLGRPRSAAAAAAHETDGFSLAAMTIMGGLCLLAGVLPSFVIQLLAPVVAQVTGAALPAASGGDWFRLAPIAAERSAYGGLVLLIAIVLVAAATVYVVHRFGSRAVRRAPAWDCGFPNADPATQYTASSFGQPIRRVFGTVAFQATETVDMPPPGDRRPARLHVVVRDPAWEQLYEPVAAAVRFAAERFNHVQFMTIRRYLTFMFTALILMLTVVALWQ